jgi:hypothetical protein
MQSNSYKKYFWQLLTIVLSVGVCGSFEAFAQQQKSDGDAVLINGNPPLRQFEVDGAIEMFELMLDINFNVPERATLRNRVIDDLGMGSPAIVKGLLAMRELNPKLENASVERFQPLRDEARLKLAIDLQKTAGKTAPFLLEIYNRAHADRTKPKTPRHKTIRKKSRLGRKSE